MPLPHRLSRRPSAEELSAARGHEVKDLLKPQLRVLFCGINPSLYSAAVGHHFARPGNRFWKTLALSGFTPHTLAPEQERKLLELGIGITNLVDRATASAAELGPEDYVNGAERLARKVRRARPRCLAFLGLDAYRRATAQPRAAVGPQTQSFGGVRTWVLPNPSGLNAHYQLPELAAVYGELAVELGFRSYGRTVDKLK